MAAKTPLVPLVDMRDAIARIRRYVAGKDLAGFRDDAMIRDAVERCIEIVSEASRRVPAELKALHPEVPWDKVAAIGNVLHHDYDEISPPLIWELIQSRLTVLDEAVERLIRRVEGAASPQ